ncbi:MAG: diacylglycerol kinase family protein [Acidobacteriota bacterium]
MCSSTGSKIISHPLHRIGIIYNPFAGGLRGSKRARLDVAVEVFQKAGRKVELYATPGPNKAGELARRAAHEGCDLVLAAGGDGTINEAINGLVGNPVVFGALPAGTANVLANELGLSNRPDRAAAQLLHAVPARIALGAYDRPAHPRRHFALMAGIGLDARIVYELDLNLKARLGKLAYWHGGFRQLGRPVPQFTIHVNGASHVASFALITRVRNYGGDFEIARRVRLTDAEFEIVIFQNQEWHDYLRFFGAVVSNRLYSTPGVAIYRATHALIGAPQEDRIYVQTDGEAVGGVPATISSVPDALTLLIPKGYTRA